MRNITAIATRMSHECKVIDAVTAADDSINPLSDVVAYALQENAACLSVGYSPEWTVYVISNDDWYKIGSADGSYATESWARYDFVSSDVGARALTDADWK